MQALAYLIPIAVIGVIALLILLKSLKSIGPTEVGLATKRLGKKLSEGNVIAMSGEAGFQHGLLMPGLRFKL